MAILIKLRRHALRVATFAFALLLAPVVSKPAAQTFNEYQLKAVFLFNFAQFVEWAPASASDSASTFSICVLGDDPFNGFLEDTVRGESVGTRRFEIKRFRKPQEAAACQIVFVSGSVSRQLPVILDGLKERPVLTVSDVDNFARRGGMVQFVTENNRIKLMINIDAARAANLTISSKLLRPAIIVTTKGD